MFGPCGSKFHHIWLIYNNFYNYTRRVAPTVDLVLLSHGDTRHTGLYAYARARWGLLAPTYATQPVQALSRLAALEHAYHVRTELPPEQHETDEVCVLPVAEINTAWEAVNALRY